MSFEEEVFGKRKLKRIWKIFLIIIIIGLLFGSIYFIYNKFFNNPVKIYETLINEAFDKVNLFFEEAEANSVYYNEDDKVRTEVNLKLDSTMNEVDDYVKYNYFYVYAYDYKNKELEIKTILKDENEKNLFDFGYRLTDSEYLIQSDVWSTKTFDFTEEFSDDMKAVLEDIEYLNYQYDFRDLNYIFNALKEIMIKSLNDKKFNIKYEKISIAGKEEYVVRYDYELDKELLNDTYDILADTIIDNSELVVILSKFLELTPDELIELINEDRNTFTRANALTISVYRRLFSSDVVKISMETMDEAKLLYENNILLFTYDKIELKLDMTDDNYLFTIKEKDELIVNLDILEINTSLIDLKYELYYEGYKFAGEVYVKESKKSDTSIFADYSFSLLTDYNGQDINFRMHGDLSQYKINELNIIDKKNVIDIDDLTEQEIGDIYNRGYKVLENTPFLEEYNTWFY